MSPEYAWPAFNETLSRERERTGLAESVTWRFLNDGEVTAVIVTGHFSFLGGSMGVEHGDIVLQAVAEAQRSACPIVFVTSSGGARTQEGFPALFQMPRVMTAISALKNRRIPVISVYRHPTTGGVHASYGAAADIIVAEAGATLGFAGPRVVGAFTGRPFEQGASHNAESYLRHGLVDEITPAGEGLSTALGWVRRLRAAAPDAVAETTVGSGSSPRGWEAVARARSAGRPSARRLAKFLLADFRETLGDRTGIEDPVVVTGFGRLGGSPLAVIGTDRCARRDPESPMGAPHAAGFRKASRVVAIASRLRIPVLSIIDTRGADPGARSDSSGLTAAISGLTSELLACNAPTLSIVSGEGGSGGAIAFASTDALIMQDDSVFEIIAPEGAASILHRDLDKTELMADQMNLDAAWLHTHGYADAVVPGPTSIGVFPSMALLRAAIRARLLCLLSLDDDTLQTHRRERFR